jgi:hypothetical protein
MNTDLLSDTGTDRLLAAIQAAPELPRVSPKAPTWAAKLRRLHPEHFSRNNCCGARDGIGCIVNHLGDQVGRTSGHYRAASESFYRFAPMATGRLIVGRATLAETADIWNRWVDLCQRGEAP